MADDKTYLALADEHQWKSFNDLSQIGITAGSETIMDIIVAMPEGSDLSYEIRASQHNHDAYPYPTGTITIKKYSDSACDVEHVCSANNEYRGTWRMYAVGSANTWMLSDWHQVYDAVNPPTVDDVAGARPNANLLHNWYFGNPVNRNGKTEFTAGGCIDRWKLHNSSSKARLDDDCLTIWRDGSIGGSYYTFQQVTIVDLEKNAGRRVCFSVYVKEPTDLFRIALCTEDSPTAGFYGTDVPAGTVGVKSVVCNLPTNKTGKLIVTVFTSTADSEIKLIASKLEYGDTQTLAHQNSDGNWVLNEIPDYAEQMAICMQYDKTTGAYTGITAANVGAVPTINAYGSTYDMDVVFASGQHFGMYETNQSTLGTPYKYGKSPYGLAAILSLRSESYGVQTAFVVGTNLIFSRTYNNGTISEWSTGFLPLDGSVAMSGNLIVKKASYPTVRVDDTTKGSSAVVQNTGHAVALGMRNVEGSVDNTRGLYVRDNESTSPNLENALQLQDAINGTSKYYNIFGEHNKPSGTYSGNNGSQTIDTGGLGDVILVQLTGSGGGFALVTKSGAIGKLNSNNSVFALADTEAKFIGGVLTLNSSNYAVNRSGYGYNWQVL